ncbi:hypothetical protein [Nitrincola tibetensis]|uniref:hypothetical protein n=1 Tax=Nitrincola tibetensis TaxID=2219697 RepID=UPI0012E3F23C|nr:hypothetical protein [Nitrincola tibetensis]
MFDSIHWHTMQGLEAAMDGCQIGDQVSVTPAPDQAFGEHREELVFEAVRDNLLC